MKQLTGLGIWIWELAACAKGDVAAMVAQCQRANVSWVAVKAGEHHSNGQVTRALVEACAAAGIRCAAWWYCTPTSLDTQLVFLKELVTACGIDALLMDAEVEWDNPDQRALAAVFAAQLRAAVGPDVFLADAPWARPISHKAPFPYVQFGSVMDARMPQFYWELAEVAGEAFTHFMAKADLEWAQTAPGAVLCPTLSTVNEDGTKHAPVSELAAALDRYAEHPAVSIWSYQHLTADEWALLEERAVAAAAPAW